MSSLAHIAAPRRVWVRRALHPLPLCAALPRRRRGELAALCMLLMLTRQVCVITMVMAYLYLTETLQVFVLASVSYLGS